MNKKTIQSVFLGMILLLMYLPILLLAVYSFMDLRSLEDLEVLQ